MAMRKLTLSATDEVIATAKGLAAKEGSSVSAIFARLLTAAAGPGRGAPLAPVTRRASGLIRLADARTDQQLLTEALEDRYGGAS
jgi:hypothetical protein